MALLVSTMDLGTRVAGETGRAEQNTSASAGLPRAQPSRISLRSFDRRSWIVLLVTWAVSLAYAAAVLRYGWIPRDEGLLAHSAERVLQGQLPHRDFQDMYVGLLSYLHSFAFRAWGANLMSLRFMLFGFFALFVPAVYWIASRMTSRLGAAAATLIAVAWSVPNYSASMPSWYNLFFATFGVAALIAYIEVNSFWFLFLAGVAAGISILFKITGIYFVAAALLFFLWRSTRVRVTRAAGEAGSARVWMSLGIFAFVAAVVFLLRSRLGLAEIYHFLVPTVALALVALWSTWSGSKEGLGPPSIGSVARMAVPFCLGAILPVAVFTAAYAREGALGSLIRGALVLPTKRISLVGRSPAPLISLVPMLLVLVPVVYSARVESRQSRLISAGLAVGLVIMLALSGRSAGAFTFCWFICATLIPAVVLIACRDLVRSRPGSGMEEDRLMLLTGTVALCSLIQYPFSDAAYFCYVAPLLVLAIVPLLELRPVPRATIWVLAIFALLFPALRLRPFMERDGFSHVSLVRLVLPRAGGLYVRSDEAQEYQSVVPVIQQHAAANSYIYAFPDDPQIYFLAGMQNPGKVMYSVFQDTPSNAEQMWQNLARHDVHVVVIDSQLARSYVESPELLRTLVSKFPQSQVVGRFEVRWE